MCACVLLTPYGMSDTMTCLVQFVGCLIYICNDVVFFVCVCVCVCVTLFVLAQSLWHVGIVTCTMRYTMAFFCVCVCVCVCMTLSVPTQSLWRVGILTCIMRWWFLQLCTYVRHNFVCVRLDHTPQHGKDNTMYRTG